MHFYAVKEQFLRKHYLKGTFKHQKKREEFFFEQSALFYSQSPIQQTPEPHPALDGLTCQAPSTARSIFNDFFFPRRNRLFYVPKYADHFA